MFKGFFSCFFFLMLICLSRCQPSSSVSEDNLENKFKENIINEVNYFDDRLIVTVDLTLFDEYNSIIYYDLDNQTGYDIWFDFCFGRELFTASNNGIWEKIDLGECYSNVDSFILTTNGDYRPLGFSIDKSITQEPREYRLLVIGTIYNRGQPTDKTVGSYVDFILPP